MTEFDLVAALLQDYAQRHKPIAEVYDRFKHLDTVLSDPVWTQDEWEDDAALGLHHVLYDCWQAIKVACEQEGENEKTTEGCKAIQAGPSWDSAT